MFLSVVQNIGESRQDEIYFKCVNEGFSTKYGEISATKGDWQATKTFIRKSQLSTNKKKKAFQLAFFPVPKNSTTCSKHAQESTISYQSNNLQVCVLPTGTHLMGCMFMRYNF